MNIKGKKVVLRAIEPKDAKLLYEIINDQDIEYMLGGWSFPVSSTEQQAWIEKTEQNHSNQILRVMIDIKKMDYVTDNSDINDCLITIGTAILSDIDYKNGSAQIHIKIANGDFRGRGYGTDTVNTLVNYAFQELRLHCIYAKVNSYNSYSNKMFEKCGFVHEGILRDRIYKQGNYHDVTVLSIINKES